MKHTLSLWSIIAICLLTIASIRAEERAAAAFKGMELYSFKSTTGEWRYVLLQGTNRLKDQNEVKSAPNQAKSVKEIGEQLAKLSEDEHVSWHKHKFVPGMEYPDAKTIKEIQNAAQAAKIKLNM